MHKKLTNFLDWFLFRDILKYKDDINRRNFLALQRLTGLGVIISFSNVLLQISADTIYAVFSSIIMLIGFIAGFIAILSVSRKGIPDHSTAALYSEITFALFISLLNGTFLDTKNTAFTVSIFMVTLTLLIIDKPLHLTLYTTVWAFLIIILSILTKKPMIAKLDITQTIMAYMTALMAGNIVLSARIENVKNTFMLINSDKTDAQTCLYNRKYFIATAQDMIEKDKTSNKVLAYYDISGTRNFNRDFGFSEGDKLLKEFAKIIKEVFPDKLSARFGEDHFVVLLDDGEWRSAYNQLYSMLDQYIFEKFNNHIISVTDGAIVSEESNGTEIQLKIKYGICPLSGRSTSVTLACDRARIACHNIKENEIYRVYDETLEIQAKKEKYVLEHFDDALKNNYIKVYYQPVVRSMTGELCGQEALSRWDDPDKGLLSPADFIPVLENHMLLYKLDLYVIEQALKDFKTKEEKGIELIPISVNLSRNDFEGRDMVRIISDLVDSYGYSHNLVDIEITESAYTDSPERIKNVIVGFHSAGFKVWMDDFGSGYSSLNMLQDCNFDLIKLDMLFMRDFGVKNEMIIKSVISMANRLGIDTLAEGVETSEQSLFLKKAGCDRQQGFLYDRPEPLSCLIKNYRINGCYKTFEASQYTGYFETISKVNMADPFTYFNDHSGLSNTMGTLPVSIIEWNRDKQTFKFMRANESLAYVASEFIGQDLDFDTIGSSAAKSFSPKAFLPDFNPSGLSIRNEWYAIDSFLAGKSFTDYFHYVATDPVTGHDSYIVVTIIHT